MGFADARFIAGPFVSGIPVVSDWAVPDGGTMTTFTESVVEDATLAWLEELGYAVLHGPDIASGEPAAERTDPEYRDVVLEGRLQQALVALNPDLRTEGLDEACRR